MISSWNLPGGSEEEKETYHDSMAPAEILNQGLRSMMKE
jgi:hypothetical protein